MVCSDVADLSNVMKDVAEGLCHKALVDQLLDTLDQGVFLDSEVRSCRLQGAPQLYCRRVRYAGI